MNSIERVGAAIELREPDRVPVDLHDFQVAARASGLPMSEIFRDGALLAEAMLTAWREFGHDMILLENGTACSAEACGMDRALRRRHGTRGRPAHSRFPLQGGRPAGAGPLRHFPDVARS